MLKLQCVLVPVVACGVDLGMDRLRRIGPHASAHLIAEHPIVMLPGGVDKFAKARLFAHPAIFVALA